MSAAAQEKQAMRRALIAARRALPEVQRHAYDRAITACVLESAAWQTAKTVFAYVGTGWEIDTRALILSSLAAGKRVAVPLCEKDGIMTAREIRSLSDLAPGAYGIPEPTQDAPILPPEETDLAIIPAVAFDRAGYRLGRGGGYYDRYLPWVRGIAMGLAHTCFLQDAVPREAHDCRVDLIITEKGEILWA